MVNQLVKYDGIIQLLHRPGKFVNEGESLGVVHAKRWQKNAADKFNRYFIIGHCRTDDQDPEYGISQLVEVAVRALSPGINDPHTAISCIDWLGSGLRQIADKPLRSIYCCDHNSQVRLIRQEINFAGMLNAAFDQIRQNSRSVPTVAIRLLEALDCIYTVARESVIRDEKRQSKIAEQARLVIEGAENCGWQSRDIEDLKGRYHHLMEENGE